VRYVQSGLGIESYLPYKILCLYFCGFPRLRNFCVLGEAYQRTRTDSAPGIDGVRAEGYAEHLEENLRDLHERIQSGRYRAAPVKRTWALHGGWKSAADRQADIRGQDCPTGGGVAVGGYL
jgi:hypothetical protein